MQAELCIMKFPFSSDTSLHCPILESLLCVGGKLYGTLPLDAYAHIFRDSRKKLLKFILELKDQIASSPVGNSLSPAHV